MEGKAMLRLHLERHKHFWCHRCHENWPGQRKFFDRLRLILLPQQSNRILADHECPYDLAHGWDKGSYTNSEHQMLLLDTRWLMMVLDTCNHWARMEVHDCHDARAFDPLRGCSRLLLPLQRNPLVCRKGWAQKMILDELLMHWMNRFHFHRYCRFHHHLNHHLMMCPPVRTLDNSTTLMLTKINKKL